MATATTAAASAVPVPKAADALRETAIRVRTARAAGRAAAIRPVVATARPEAIATAGTSRAVDSLAGSVIRGRTGRPVALAVAMVTDPTRAVGANRRAAGGLVTSGPTMSAADSRVAAGVALSAATTKAAVGTPLPVGAVVPVALPGSRQAGAAAGNRKAAAGIRPPRGGMIAIPTATIPVGRRLGGRRRPGRILCGLWLGTFCGRCGSGMLTRIWCCPGCFGSGGSVGGMRRLRPS